MLTRVFDFLVDRSTASAMEGFSVQRKIRARKCAAMDTKVDTKA